MRESQKYLQFFKQNSLIILGPAVAFGVVAFLYVSSLPVVSEQTEVWELPYTTDNIQTQVVMTDQAIGVMRSLTLKKELGLSDETEVILFKPSPLLISFTTKGSNLSQQAKDLEILTTYSQEKYAATQVGSRITTQTKMNQWVYVAASVAVGGLLGVLISLIKIYFQKY